MENFDGEPVRARARTHKFTMSGKFLPYKYYGSEQGIQEYGVKEP